MPAFICVWGFLLEGILRADAACCVPLVFGGHQKSESLICFSSPRIRGGSGGSSNFARYLDKALIDAPAEQLCPLGVEMQTVGLKGGIACIHDMEIGVFCRQAVQCADDLLAAVTALVGERAADEGQPCIAAVTSLPHEVATDIGDHGLQVVIVVGGHFLVALALVPKEGLYLKAILVAGQVVVDAGSDILGECFEQRLAALVGCGIGRQESRRRVPVHPVVARACRVDGRTAQRLLDDIEIALGVSVDEIVDDGIIPPPLLVVGSCHTGPERLEVAAARDGVAAIRPQAVTVAFLLDIVGKVVVAHPSVGVRLSGCDNHAHRFLLCGCS